MSLFGGSTGFGSPFAQNNAVQPTAAFGNSQTQKRDMEVTSPPDDSVSAMAFSPGCVPTTLLIASSWDSNVRCWEVKQDGSTQPKAQQTHQGPILDVAWSDDGTKVFTASCDKTAKMWDLNSNQTQQIAQHDGPVRTAHWIKGANYSCLMTSSWDKTLKFWDTRSPQPMMNIQLPERAYCADVSYPMAVVGTAGRGLIIYQLENQPQEFKRIESPLKYQHRCVRIFRDKTTQAPTGFALGSIEGRVAIQYVNPKNPKDNFTFKCHRSNAGSTNGVQDIFAVNDIAFHPAHGTLSTVGSDGRFSFWDKDARTKLKTSDQFDLPISCATFNSQGNIFAYACSYDWSKGHEGFDPHKMKPKICLRSCFDDLKPSQKKS